MANPEADMVGLRQQILANAQYLLPKAAIENIPNYGFEVVIRTDLVANGPKTKLIAVLMHGRINERKVAAQGDPKYGPINAYSNLFARMVCSAGDKMDEDGLGGVDGQWIDHDLMSAT